MVERASVWEEMEQAMNAIVQNLRPLVQEAIQKSQFDGVQGWFHLGLGYYIHPDPLTADRIRQRNPYNKHETQEAVVSTLKEAGFLDSNGVITEAAIDEYKGLIGVQDDVARSLNLMDASKLARVAQLLERVHDAALKMDAPCFTDLATKPLPENTLHRIYYLIYRFRALRDDAHLQAWRRDLDVDAHTFEALSLVWDGTADTAAQITEQRGFRGYDETEWQKTLDAVVAKGWLNRQDDSYSVTDVGKKIRDDIETWTDDFFYQAFAVLSDNDIQELVTLLRDIQENFTPEPQIS